MLGETIDRSKAAVDRVSRGAAVSIERSRARRARHA